MRHAKSPTPSVSGYSLMSGSRSPLPEPVSFGCATATAKATKFVRRLFKFQQMDFEFAAWQLLYLFYKPKQVYKNFHYRKQTKAQFARDDPAFLVLLCLTLCFSSIGMALVLGLGVGQTIWFLLYVVFVDCILCGLITASLFWFVSNRYWRSDRLEGDVEFGYSFDVHLNAFYPPLVILHCVQLFFYHIAINHEWFISRFLGNSLWLLAILYYLYITFLGYNCIPFLKNTRTILIAMPVAFIVYVVTLIIGLNLCVTLMDFYHYRVL